MPPNVRRMEPANRRPSQDCRLRHVPLGGVVYVASGVRLYFLLQIDTKDLSWLYSSVVTWTTVEINVAVVSACLPTMKPMFISLLPTIFVSMLRGTRPVDAEHRSSLTKGLWQRPKTGRLEDLFEPYTDDSGSYFSSHKKSTELKKVRLPA